MSIYYGDDAITYLAKKAHQQDPKSSSHWDFYHSDYRFDDDELCPWHLKYYSTKPPFYHDYDGPIRHRLAQFL
jgi:hypothetical protein